MYKCIYICVNGDKFTSKIFIAYCMPDIALVMSVVFGTVVNKNRSISKELYCNRRKNKHMSFHGNDKL